MTAERSAIPRIGFIGECMVELRQGSSDTLHRSFAGDTLNTALYMARLQSLHAHQVHYITALGQDQFSQAMLDQWRSENICCDYVRRIDDRLPGLYFVEVDNSGERYFHYWRSQSAARELFADSAFNTRLAALKKFDYLYLSGISLAILPAAGREALLELLGAAKAQGAGIVFDNNYRPKLWPDTASAQEYYRRALQLTTIACLTFDDEVALWGDDASEQTFARCKSLGVEEIVIKQGADPCLIDAGGRRASVAPPAVAGDLIIDTSAAGDSFSAGYLAGRLGGHQVQASAALGHRIAGTVIRHRGAIMPPEAMPKLSI